MQGYKFVKFLYFFKSFNEIDFAFDLGKKNIRFANSIPF